jgi:hypothetical protein
MMKTVDVESGCHVYNLQPMPDLIELSDSWYTWYRNFIGLGGYRMSYIRMSYIGWSLVVDSAGSAHWSTSGPCSARMPIGRDLVVNEQPSSFSPIGWELF